MTAMLGKLKALGVSLLGLGVLAAILLLQFVDLPYLSRVRMMVFDTYQTLQPRPTDTQNSVVIVDIDEQSIEDLGQWPWPRSDLAVLTERLGKAGASVVVFDIVFSEPDRTSPEAIASRLREGQSDPAFLASLADLPGHDDQLAASFAAVPVVTAFFLDFAERGRDIEPKANFTLSGTLPEKNVASYQGALQPLPNLEAAAQGNGFVSLKADADGIVRRVPLVAIHRGALIPGLSLEALRVAEEAGSPNLLTSDGSGQTLSAPGSAVAVRIGEAEIPVNDAGEMWVHFPEPGANQILPAAPIVNGTTTDARLAEVVKDKIVLIGGSAAGLQDLVSTPVSERIGGVTVHAAALEQMLAGDFLQRPDWAYGLELLLVLLFGVFASLLFPRLGSIFSAFVAALAIMLTIGASWLGFVQLNFLLDPTYPVLALAVIYSVQTVAVYYREEQQRSYIHSAFDRFLSPELVRQIVDDPSKLELGGEERDMSVLMCDIRGFSKISEQYTPKEVIDFLIEFLTPMSELLLEHKATLDKYIGDAILAFWNAPLHDPDHHRNAARAALAMTEKLIDLNRIMPGNKEHTWPGEVRIGIGLNSGLCCVGNMGSKQRLAYSLIGDTVNVAARLEGLTKQYGVRILVGEAMSKELQGFALLEIDRVRVVGREAAETISVLLGDENTARAGSFARLSQAQADFLAAYRARQWDEAMRILAGRRQLYEAADLGRLVDLFERRLDQIKAEPPSDEWDGTFQAVEK